MLSRGDHGPSVWQTWTLPLAGEHYTFVLLPLTVDACHRVPVIIPFPLITISPKTHLMTYSLSFALLRSTSSSCLSIMVSILTLLLTGNSSYSVQWNTFSLPHTNQRTTCPSRYYLPTSTQPCPPTNTRTSIRRRWYAQSRP